jgi:hypothetical protein
MTLAACIASVRTARDPKAFVAKKLADLRGELIALRIYANALPSKVRAAYIRERETPILAAIANYEKVIR